ncbi:MAG: flagellar export protein FliJ [Deltaproteobacteria bacterium]|nr:flagellar export protein FliJ [Deltaproteobacteria bacterium]
MKPFSFRLDSILNYRNYLEKRARRNLANAISEYIGWEREIERLSKKRIEIAGKCSDEGLRGMDVPKYHMYRSFLQRVSDDLERANMSLKKAEEKIEEKKSALKDKSIKKKTLETLKDLQRKRYMRRLETEEQKTIDELVIMKKEGRA